MDKIIFPPILIGFVSLKAGDFQQLMQEIYFDEIDEENISKIKDNFETKEWVEFKFKFYSLVVNQSVQYFQRSDYVRPEWSKKYILCFLNYAKYGCNLGLICFASSKHCRKSEALKAWLIFLVININKI